MVSSTTTTTTNKKRSTTSSTTPIKAKRNHTTTSSNSSSSNKKAKNSSSSSSSSSNSNQYKNTTQPSQQQQQQQNVVLRPRKNATIVEEGKRLWNLLRCKTNTTEQIRTIMDELIPLITNKVIELTMQHDASRIVQAAIQFGNTIERQMIVKELCYGTTSNSSSNSNSKTNTSSSTTTTTISKYTFLDICQSQYAHFVILKILKYCMNDPINVPIIINALKGTISKLITHITGSRIIEVLFQNNTTSNHNNNTNNGTGILPKDTAILKQEMYGPHYTLFAYDTIQQLQQLQKDVTTALTGNNSNTNNKKFVIPTLYNNIQLLLDKEMITIEYVRNHIIIKAIDKQLIGYNYIQMIFYEYIYTLRKRNDEIEVEVTTTNNDDDVSNGKTSSNSSLSNHHPSTYYYYYTNEIRNITTSTNITDHCIHLLSSKMGTYVVCAMIAYSTVKDRKRIMKSIKGYTYSALFHKDAYLAIIQFIISMDDTVALHKNILQELLNNSNNNNNTTSTQTLSSSMLQSISKSKEITDKKDNNNDNNVSLQKQHPLIEIALSDTASKFLLLLLVSTTTTTTGTTPIKESNTNRSNNTSNTNNTTTNHTSYSKILSPYEKDVLIMNAYIYEKGDVNDGSSNSLHTSKQYKKVYTSKKDNEVRRLEILQYFHIPLLQQVTSTNSTSSSSTNTMTDLLVSISGSNVLYHLYVASINVVTMTNPATTSSNDDALDTNNTNSSGTVVPPKLLSNYYNHKNIPTIQQLLNDMIQMICTICRQNMNIVQESNNSTNVNIFEHVVGHRIIKNLILYDATLLLSHNNNNDSKPMHTFTELFVQQFVSKDFMSMIQYNRGAFIVVALLQVPKIRQHILDQLDIPLIMKQQQQQKESSGQKLVQSKNTSVAGLNALRQEISRIV